MSGLSSSKKKNRHHTIIPEFGIIYPPIPIPVDRRFWETLCSADAGRKNLDLIKRTFVLSNSPTTFEVETKIWHAMSAGRLHRQTENSFHMVRDAVFTDLLALLCEGITFVWNSNFETSTSQQRLDLCIYINNKCMFRGEEKQANVSISKPCLELSEKIVDWQYGGVMYLLGYASSGLNVQL